MCKKELDGKGEMLVFLFCFYEDVCMCKGKTNTIIRVSTHSCAPSSSPNSYLLLFTLGWWGRLEEGRIILEEKNEKSFLCEAVGDIE